MASDNDNDRWLLLDCGNTRFKWACLEGDSLVDTGASDYDRVSAVFMELVQGLCFDGVGVCSVASDSKLADLLSLVEQNVNANIHFAEVSSHDGGVFNSYLALDQLGVDRWVAAIGAVVAAPAHNLIVIDAGTAITIDVVAVDAASGNSNYLGGAILPGLGLMHDVLVGKTARIRSERVQVSDVVGRNTSECVNSGAFYGAVGAVERVVKEILERDGARDEYKVILCGGDSDHIASLIKLDLDVLLEPNLLFMGLSEMTYKWGRK